LVQASLSGKTRLLIEIGLERPLILIAFKADNHTFSRLVQEIATTWTPTFKETLNRARCIFLLTRLFYLSYTYFFRICFEGGYNKSSKNDRKIFMALLLNGGGKLVEYIFSELLSHYNFKNLDLSDQKVTCYSRESNVSLRFIG
jgi:hypothetical protein